MGEQAIIFVLVACVLQKASKRLFYVSQEHLADTFTSEEMSSELLQCVRLKFIPLIYIVSFSLMTAL